MLELMPAVFATPLADTLTVQQMCQLQHRSRAG